MSCTYESHEVLRSDRVRFVAGTEPAGQWEPDETGHTLEVRRCRLCGSLLSDGTDASAPQMVLVAPPELHVLARVKEERLPLVDLDEGDAASLGNLLACVFAIAGASIIAWILVRFFS